MKLRNFVYLLLTIAFITIWVLLIYFGKHVFFELLKTQPEPPYAKEQITFATTLYTEVFKYMIQFTLVTIAGALLIKEYEHARARRQAVKKFRDDTCTDLVATYLTVKRARWELRADYRYGQIKFAVYQAAIVKLVELKSRVETLEFSIEGFPGAFDTKEKESLLLYLRGMEKYIDGIVDECANYADSSRTVVTVAKYDQLNGFLRNRDKDKNETKEDTPFGKGYRLPVKKAIAVLNSSKPPEVFEFASKFQNSYAYRWIKSPFARPVEAKQEQG